MSDQALPVSNGIEASSGKGAGDENFPVGSVLIARRLRPHVMRFYDFARAADDVADSPDLTAAEKLARCLAAKSRPGADYRPSSRQTSG